MQKEYHILSLSGGKDSTALAFFIKENMPEIHEKIEYVFADTEHEIPETYDYLNKIEVFLNKKITRIKPAVSFEHIVQTRKMLPSPARRWCTVELKTKPFQFFLKKKSKNFKNKIILYIGIRADEADRVLTSTSRYDSIIETFPFVENNIDKEDVLKILKNVGINLPDFYKWKRRSGCYFCFYQNQLDWINLFEHYPELYKKSMNLELKHSSIKRNGFFGLNALPLAEIIKTENINEIKKKYANSKIKNVKIKNNLKLMNII